MLGAAAYFVTHLKLISRYVRESLSERLHGHLAWENRKISQITPDSEREAGSHRKPGICYIRHGWRSRE